MLAVKLAETLVQFPEFEIPVHSLVAAAGFPAIGFSSFPEKYGVEQRRPSYHHEAYVSAGFEFHRRLVVDLNSKQG
jgi:hypothetical protein